MESSIAVDSAMNKNSQSYVEKSVSVKEEKVHFAEKEMLVNLNEVSKEQCQEQTLEMVHDSGVKGSVKDAVNQANGLTENDERNESTSLKRTLSSTVQVNKFSLKKKVDTQFASQKSIKVDMSPLKITSSSKLIEDTSSSQVTNVERVIEDDESIVKECNSLEKITSELNSELVSATIVNTPKVKSNLVPKPVTPGRSVESMRNIVNNIAGNITSNNNFGLNKGEDGFPTNRQLFDGNQVPQENKLEVEEDSDSSLGLIGGYANESELNDATEALVDTDEETSDKILFTENNSNNNEPGDKMVGKKGILDSDNEEEVQYNENAFKDVFKLSEQDNNVHVGSLPEDGEYDGNQTGNDIASDEEYDSDAEDEDSAEEAYSDAEEDDQDTKEDLADEEVVENNNEDRDEEISVATQRHNSNNFEDTESTVIKSESNGNRSDEETFSEREEREINEEIVRRVVEKEQRKKRADSSDEIEDDETLPIKGQQRKLSTFGFTKETEMRKSASRRQKSTNSKSNKKNSSSTTNVTFSETNEVQLITPTQEDDINTVASDETSRNMSKKDERKSIPPTYIRY